MLDAGKISRAVTDCLHLCYAAPSPLGALAQYVGGLAGDPHWSAYEVEAVEIRVLRVLSRVVSQSDEKHENGPRSVSVTVNPQNFPERQSQKPPPSPNP